jgi:ribonuclease HI
LHSLLQCDDPNQNLPNTISDLWISGSKIWDLPKIISLFGPHAATLIQQIPISNHNKPDILCWRPSTKGTCSSKEAYKHLATSRPVQPNPTGSRAISPQAQNLLNKIWKHKTLQPRHKAFAWRLIRQAIASGTRAARLSTKIDKNCTRCGSEETDDHLFFNCSFARAVWFVASPPVRTDHLPQGTGHVQQQLVAILSTNKSMQEQQRVITTLWFIWKARNDLRFNNKTWTILQVLHAVAADINIINTYYMENMDAKQQQNRGHPTQHQTNGAQGNQYVDMHALHEVQGHHNIDDQPHPQPTGVQVFVDAAIHQVPQRYLSRKAGLGVHIQGDIQGRPVELLIQATHLQAQDPLHAEALALELSSKILNALNFQHVSYRTDSQLLSSTINDQDPILYAADWRIRALIAQFIHNNRNSTYTCSKIPRQNNKTAHTLAKFALRATNSSFAFTCINVQHTGSCPFQLATAFLPWDDFIPNLVNCL